MLQQKLRKRIFIDFEINTQFVIPEEKIEGISSPAKFYTVKGFDVQQIPKTADFLLRQKRRAEIENQSDVLIFNYDNIFLRPKVILKDKGKKQVFLLIDFMTGRVNLNLKNKI